MYNLIIVGSLDEARKKSVSEALLTRLSSFFSADAAQTSFTLCLDAEDTATIKPLYQQYHYRYVWTEVATVEELVTALSTFLTTRHNRAQGSFTSTRGSAEAANFFSVVLDGLGNDGGLYILKNIAPTPASQLHYLCKARHLSYVEVAQMVLEQLVDHAITPAALYPLVVEAYEPSRWSGKVEVCPITSLLHPEEAVPSKGAAAPHAEDARWARHVSVMELFHGPTAAFKDFALQLFPHYFGVAAAAQQQEAHQTKAVQERYVVLAATSGDTGVAAISGFVNAGRHAQVMVLYPMHGVSPVQQLQMLSYDDGAQVRVYGVDSNFDFCQRSVKDIFSDEALKQKLAPQVKLSSANSINWGRLIPQVVYYVWAYRHLVQHPPPGWRYGDVVDFVVPCGNFGNILSGYLAKLMGVPVRKFIVASNQNDVLYEFIETGTYDVRSRTLTLTASPSIDILKASNVERFLFLLSGGDTAFVRTMMAQLDTEGSFTLPAEMKATMQESFCAGRCSEEECAQTIKDVYDASHHTRLLDPHTAVAVYVAKQFRESEMLQRDLQDPIHAAEDATDAKQPPLLVASTAHWAKFPSPVLHSMHGEGAQLGSAATSVAEAVSLVRGLYQQITKENALQAHPQLLHAIDVAERDATEARALEADLGKIKAQLQEFAAVPQQ